MNWLLYRKVKVGDSLEPEGYRSLVRVDRFDYILRWPWRVAILVPRTVLSGVLAPIRAVFRFLDRIGELFAFFLLMGILFVSLSVYSCVFVGESRAEVCKADAGRYMGIIRNKRGVIASSSCTRDCSKKDNWYDEAGDQSYSDTFSREKVQKVDVPESWGKTPSIPPCK